MRQMMMLGLALVALGCADMEPWTPEGEYRGTFQVGDEGSSTTTEAAAIVTGDHLIELEILGVCPLPMAEQSRSETSAAYMLSEFTICPMRRQDGFEYRLDVRRAGARIDREGMSVDIWGVACPGVGTGCPGDSESFYMRFDGLYYGEVPH